MVRKVARWCCLVIFDLALFFFLVEWCYGFVCGSWLRLIGFGREIQKGGAVDGFYIYSYRLKTINDDTK